METALDYSKLSADIANVLCTGDAGKMLAALPELWDDDALPTVPVPSPIPAAITTPAPALPVRNSFLDNIPTDEEDEDLRHPATMFDWVAQRKANARKPFMPMFDEICVRVRRGDFATQGAIAKAYNKPELWARQLRAVVVKQGVFRNDAEWWSCFSRRLKDGSTKPSTYNPQLTARKPAGVGGTPQRSRVTFEKVMQEQRKLDFDTVIQMIRFRCWATTHDLCEHFHQTPAWAVSLRAFVIREGLFTAESWVKCFGRDRRPVSHPSQAVS